MEQVRIERYFAGTRLNWKTDRLGSRDGNGYFPYGEERGTPTTNDTYKFATYWRDSTGLDYADQRYYASSFGRFLTPDPYMASGGPADPQSWNRYAYVEGDPVNFNDPRGLLKAQLVHPNPVDLGISMFLQAGIRPRTSADPQEGWDPRDFWSLVDRTNSRIRSQAANAIDKMSGSNCEKLLADKGISLESLKFSSQQLNFLDSTGYEGAFPLNSVLNNGGTQTIKAFADALVGSGLATGSTVAAATLTQPGRQGPGGNVITPNVVLTTNFAKLNAAQQGTILVHESLHYRLQFNDAQIKELFGIDFGIFVTDSDAISLWLERDCTNNSLYVPTP
jgi:RHS repeat-associated protein